VKFENYHFRSARIEDAPIVAHHAHGWGEGDPSDLVVYADWIASVIERDLYLGWFACIDDRVVAGAGAILYEGGPLRGTTSPIRARLVNVFTEQNHRKQGLSEALCARVLASVRERGVQSVALACTNHSRHIYEKLGFTPYPAEMRLQWGLSA
jgi:GNAT superfamily N-acetyltransferase